MALIKCPECNGEISSTSNQCIHCGCKITICPECGNAVKAGATNCPNCGFEFTKSVQPNESNPAKPSDDSNLKDLVQMWATRKASEKKFDIFSNIAEYGLVVISIVLFIISNVKVFGWKPDDNYPLIVIEQLTQLKNIVYNLTLWAGIIFALSKFLTRLIDVCKEKSRTKWIIDNDFDYKSLVAMRKRIQAKEWSDIKLTPDEESIYKEFIYNETMIMSYLTECKGEFKFRIIKLIVDLALLILTVTFTVRICLELQFITLNNATSLTEHIELYTLDITNIIVVGSALLVKLIFDFSIWIIFERRKDKWVETIESI